MSKPNKTITIDSEAADDWMKSLPGYKDEIKLSDELAAKLKAKALIGDTDAK